MEKRLGKIEILGKEYPLNFSVRIAQEFNDILGEKATGAFSNERKNIKALALMLRDGAAYSKAVLGESVDPPSVEALELIFTPADNERIVQAIQETVERGGMRLVHARPKKNEAEAGPVKAPKG